MLNVIILSVIYVECFYSECRYTECRGANYLHLFHNIGTESLVIFAIAKVLRYSLIIGC
jgi:hypothetical protein